MASSLIVWGGAAVVCAVLAYAVTMAAAPALTLWTGDADWWGSAAGWQAMTRPLLTVLVGAVLLGVLCALARYAPAGWLAVRAGWGRYRTWLAGLEGGGAEAERPLAAARRERRASPASVAVRDRQGGKR